MDKRIALSIIIPIYNAREYIDRCMESIYTQSFEDYEIIIVDDGSNDGSTEICSDYAKRDSRVVFLKKENGGAGSARNAGLQVARGEYVLFVDADDEIHKDLIKIAYSKAKESDYDLVVFAIEIVHSNQSSREVLKTETTHQTSLVCKTQNDFRKAFVDLYYGGTLYGAPYNKLFKRSVIVENGVLFPDLRRGQDEIFNFRFYQFVKSAIILPNALYKYYIFDTESANKKYRLSYFETTTITYFKTIKALLDSFELQDEYSQMKFQYSFVYSMGAAPDLAWNPIEKMKRRKKIEYIASIQNHPFVMELTDTIKYIPDSYEDYWKCFKKNNPYLLYRYIMRQKLINKVKCAIKSLIGRRS